MLLCEIDGVCTEAGRQDEQAMHYLEQADEKIGAVADPNERGALRACVDEAIITH